MLNDKAPRSLLRLLSPMNPEVSDVPPESDGLQQPDADGNHYHYVQDCFDTGSHRDKAIDQPQCHTNDDQDDDEINQRHVLMLLNSHGSTLPSKRPANDETYS